DDIGDYYYFRISPYIFGPGYDHKLFIFKQGLFTDDLFEEEKIDNDDYGVVEISKAEISYIYSLFLDGLFKLLDTIFQPLDGMDENIYTNIWLDYGKIEGTQILYNITSCHGSMKIIVKKMKMNWKQKMKIPK